MLKAGAWSQGLKQKLWRNAAYYFSLYVLLNLYSMHWAGFSPLSINQENTITNMTKAVQQLVLQLPQMIQFISD